VSVGRMNKNGLPKIARRATAQALCGAACLLWAACGGSKELAPVKSASAYRAELRAAAEEINLYLNEHAPADTPRDELQRTVGGMAHAFPKIAAGAAPLERKTGDPAYGAVAGDAEDGVIVAGNLASALAADPAKHADATAKLEAAVEDWVAYNEGFASAEGGSSFEPTRWWETPGWRRFVAAGPPGTDDERREESPLTE